MMRIYLPARLEITCPRCSAQYHCRSSLLDQRAKLLCPFCSAEFSIYDGLAPQLKRKAYHAIRDHLQTILYGKYKQRRTGFSDGWEIDPDAPSPAADDGSEPHSP